MAIQNSKPTIGFKKPYICGNCGYRISETSVLKLNRPISTVTIAGEFNTTVSLKSQSFVECPYCGCDLGRVGIK